MSVNVNVNFYLISSARSYIRKTEGKISKKQELETPEPIFMFVSYGKGKRFRAPVGKKVTPKDWDDKKKRVKSSDPRSKQINELLAAMETWIDDIHTEILKERYIQRQFVDVSFEDFKSEHIPVEYFSEKFEDLHTSGRYNVMDILDKFIKKHSKERDLKGGSTSNWESFRKTLKEFEDKYGKLEFSSFTRDFEDDYIDFWINEGQTNSTVNNKMRFFKQFLQWACDEKYHTNNAFLKWNTILKTLDDDDNIWTLNEEEIGRINSLDLDGKDKIVKDAFVFNCYIGLRFDDLRTLQKNDVKQENGKRFLEVRTGKTEKTAKIPLIKITYDIIDKYSKEPGNRLIPVPNIGSFNERLKSIARMAKVNKEITHMKRSGRSKKAIKTIRQKCEVMSSHVARKSFVTIAHNRYNFTLDEIRLITLHKSDAIKRYLKASDDKKIEIMHRFENGDTLSKEARLQTS